MIRTLSELYEYIFQMEERKKKKWSEAKILVLCSWYTTEDK